MGSLIQAKPEVGQSDDRFKHGADRAAALVRSRPTLRRGDRNGSVKLLQEKLNAAGLTPLALLVPDGDFGATTELHVAEFQRRHGLVADGIVGARTWRALDDPNASAELRPVPDDHALRGGLSTPSVEASAEEPSWVRIARAEIGMKEIKGDLHNPRVVEYLKTTGSWWSTDETPWCSGFVNWVMAQSGYTGTGSAKATSWLDWGQKVDQPAMGAIGVISYGGGKGHVGIVVGKQGGNVLLLGGNQSDQVKISTFAVGKFSAFVFPADYKIPPSASNLQETKGDHGKPVGFESTR